MTLLEQVATEYRLAHGMPEYRYFRKHVAWVKERRKPGYHVTPFRDGEEVSREEYEANIAESEKSRSAAFMGRLPTAYWSYNRKMVKEGWREILIRDVQTMPEPT